MFTNGCTIHSGKGREPQLADQLQDFHQWFEPFQSLYVLQAQEG
jgi:hypothetical protein